MDDRRDLANVRRPERGTRRALEGVAAMPDAVVTIIYDNNTFSTIIIVPRFNNTCLKRARSTAVRASIQRAAEQHVHFA